MIQILPYTNKLKKEWDDLIYRSRNGTFLFHRDFMDYHSDRFVDCSFLFYRKGKLEAVLPANLSNNILYSHQGLTYGGIVVSNKMTSTDIIEAFDLLDSTLKKMEVKKVVYKAIPSFYHSIPTQEDIYALFLRKANKIATNLSSTILLNNRLGFSNLRLRGVKKAKKMGLCINRSHDFSSFWKILSDNLQMRYGKMPVHSLEDILLLRTRFPMNVILYTCVKDAEVLGGVVLFITKMVVHVQYIAASDVGKQLGALDLLFHFLIHEEYKDFAYFDFGQSTENQGSYLNQSLIFQKEGFGGRGAVYETYEYIL